MLNKKKKIINFLNGTYIKWDKCPPCVEPTSYSFKTIDGVEEQYNKLLVITLLSKIFDI